MPTGRPFGISDREIDVALPLDLDEDVTEEELAGYLARRLPLPAEGTSISLSSFLHIVRLRQIESQIQQTVYRVDRDVPVPDHVVDGFLATLEAWKAAIPADASSKRDEPGVPFDGYDYYVGAFNIHAKTQHA